MVIDDVGRVSKRDLRQQKRKNELNKKRIKDMQTKLVSPEENSVDIDCKIKKLKEDLELVNVHACPHCDKHIVIVNGVPKKYNEEKQGVVKVLKEQSKSTTKNEMLKEIDKLKIKLEKVKIQEYEFKITYNKIESLQREFNSIDIQESVNLQEYKEENLKLEKLIRLEEELNSNIFDSFDSLFVLNSKLKEIDAKDITIDITNVKSRLVQIEKDIADNKSKRQQVEFLESGVKKLNEEKTVKQTTLSSVIVENKENLEKEVKELETKVIASEEKYELSCERLRMISEQEK